MYANLVCQLINKAIHQCIIGLFNETVIKITFHWRQLVTIL